MPEPGLDIDWSTLRVEVGKFLGYGSDPDVWTDAVVADVQTIINSGARQAYFPAPAGDGSPPHCWSFMEPIITVTTVADQADYDLPAGVTVVQDPISYPADNPYGPIRITSDNQIRRLREGDSSSGIPTLAAVVPKKHGYVAAQRYMLMLWRTPSQAWDLQFKASVTPQPLSSDNQFPLGDADFHEVLLESCLAKAEERKNDAQGIHRAAYLERLIAAVYRDQKRSPAVVGYNGDPGMLRGRTRSWRNDMINHVTYNGSLPT